MARKPLSPAEVPPGAAKPQIVATVLEREIRSGVVGFGERLQSENELVQRFSVSRTTVRKGLETLSARGLITTRVGIGSFVTYRGRTIDDALGWSRALAAAGADVETRLLSLAVVEDPGLAGQLGLDDPTFVAVDRCRVLADDRRAISIERSRLPMAPDVAHVPVSGLADGSLHRTLALAGLVPEGGEEWADVATVSPEDAALFGCAPGTAMLRTRRLTRTASGRPIEHVTSLLDTSVFALHLEF
jgi:GntR family transcriptional regulator